MAGSYFSKRRCNEDVLNNVTSLVVSLSDSVFLPLCLLARLFICVLQSPVFLRTNGQDEKGKGRLSKRKKHEYFRHVRPSLSLFEVARQCARPGIPVCRSVCAQIRVSAILCTFPSVCALVRPCGSPRLSVAASIPIGRNSQPIDH